MAVVMFGAAGSLPTYASAAGSGAPSAGGETTSVIVQAAPGGMQAAEAAVRALDGHVDQELGIINGFAATVHTADLGRLSVTRSISGVSPNDAISAAGSSYDPSTDSGYSMYDTTTLTGARAFWQAGYTGKGVDVAVIDSGVASVPALSGAGKIVSGPDLSPESQSATLQHVDTFGHGTFVAGLIAGHDPALTAPYAQAGPSVYAGMAPDARLVPVKVATRNGATDVSQVIAAIDWVVQHKNDHGLNIRILNLSYGTNSLQPYIVDPLAYAAEQAWKHGIVVVASAGNTGYQAGAGAVGLADPAYDPYIIAVGASDSMGTVGLADDKVAAYSAGATGPSALTSRAPDFVAPGSHIQGLRDPGSYIDTNYPTGQLGASYFRGSGTSQAAAISTGAIALLLQKFPTMTPDQVKAFIKSDAAPVANTPSNVQGSGEIQLRQMLTQKPAAATQKFASSTGAGNLEDSRGQAHLTLNGVTLTGEQDIFGHSFKSAAMASLEAKAISWSGGTWNGDTWSGDTWSGDTWSGDTWSGDTWSGDTWSGDTWSGDTWSGDTWSGDTWSGDTWSGDTWSGDTWSGDTWG